MRLERLIIKNFRSYEGADILFSGSQNYIFGRNWQGKSSVMDAIGYALFGKQVFPYRIAGSVVKTQHLVRDGAKSGEVTLIFIHNGKEYTLHRTCPRDSPTLTCEDKILGESATTVKEALQELLGIDSELFVNVFYSEQDSMRNILEVNPEERKVFIETVLGFGYLKDVKLSAKHASDGLLKWVEGFTSGNIKTILDLSKNLETSVDELRKDIGILTGRIKKLGDPNKEYTQARSMAVKATEKSNEALRNLSTLDTEKSTNETLVKEISKGTCPTCRQDIPKEMMRHLLIELKDVVKTITEKLEKAKAEHEKFQSGLGKANAQMEFSQDQLAELEGIKGKKTALEEQLKENEANLKKLKKDITAYENKNIVLKRIGEEREFLNELQLAVDEFRSSLRLNMITDLENAVNYFMSKFGDGDFDAKLKINEDFGFEIQLHGNPVPIFNLSGAARDILALSLRYGLYRIAAKEIDFLLIDEPTRHMDQTNISKLKEAFNELEDQQLIIITVHDEFADAIGKKFMVEKAGSYVSKIDEIEE